jgi:hypothetical protein
VSWCRSIRVMKYIDVHMYDEPITWTRSQCSTHSCALRVDSFGSAGMFNRAMLKSICTLLNTTRAMHVVFSYLLNVKRQNKHDMTLKLTICININLW